MKKLSSIFLVIILFFCFITTRAQTSLALGDIAIIGVNSDGDDEFSFLLLKDITAGTSIYITDKGWNDASGFYTVMGDGRWQWSTSSALSAGTIVNIKTTNNGIIEAGSLVATPGTVSWVENNSTVLSYTGDQVFLYQGTETSPTLITGCSWNVESSSSDSNWDGSATSAMTSALPNQLTNGVNAIWLHASGPTEKDNFRYNCSVTSGSPDDLRSAINNLSNWSVDASNTTPYTINPFPCGFTLSDPCSEPDIPSLSANHSSVCGGSQSTISINGDLNDATQWSVYTGSCGGTLIGSTASSSFSVTPSSTTTYYIRGEGGCTTPGSCATITITVKPSYSLNESVSVCYGGSYTFPDGTIQDDITAQVVHTSNLLSVFSCDSIIETTVNVKPSYDLSESVMVCSGESYTFPDGTVENDITAQVVHTSNLLSVFSCDSIIETTVNVKPVYNLTESVMICSGESYTFPDGTVENDITAEVVHTSNLLTVLSCDSIIETTVNVKPAFLEQETMSVCDGASVEWRGETYGTTGVYTETYTSVINGCDSVYTLELVVNPLPQTFDVTGGGEYNTGGEGVAIGLSNSETGVSYTLVLDGSVTITTESGTGNALDFGNQTLEGSYTVIAENAVTGCNAVMNGSVEVTIITSTRETLDNSLSVFPNPTDGAVTIKGENIISVSVTDMSGKTVIEQFVNGNTVHIDLSGYTKSVYLVRVTTKGGTRIEKIIVE